MKKVLYINNTYLVTLTATFATCSCNVIQFLFFPILRSKVNPHKWSVHKKTC